MPWTRVNRPKKVKRTHICNKPIIYEEYGPGSIWMCSKCGQQYEVRQSQSGEVSFVVRPLRWPVD